MDQPKRYGYTFYEMSFKKAIESKLICDYKVVTFFVDKDEIGLYELFKVSNYQIGINSTAIVEGMTFNLKTFILKDSWYLEMIDFIKDGYVKLIESDDEVISGINKNKRH